MAREGTVRNTRRAAGQQGRHAPCRAQFALVSWLAPDSTLKRMSVLVFLGGAKERGAIFMRAVHCGEGAKS
jgi:hypothetical protein